MFGVIFLHLPSGFMTRAIGVDGGALWALRWSTHRSRAALGGNRGSRDTLCPIVFLAPFFLVVNISMMKLAAWRLLSVAVVANTMRPQLKALSLRWNGLIYNLDARYSQGRRKKRWAMIIILLSTMRMGSPDTMAILEM